jgi:predicted nucleotidyltransferase
VAGDSVSVLTYDRSVVALDSRVAAQTATLPPGIEAIAARISDAPPDVRGSGEEIAEVGAAIARQFQPDQNVLFGSRVYGAPTPASAVDLMVIIDTPLTPHDQRALIRNAVVPDAPFRPDIDLRTPQQIAIGLAEENFFIEAVMLRGIIPGERSGARMTDQTANASGADEHDQAPTTFDRPCARRSI